MDKDNEYETKCRRCGRKEKWFHSHQTDVHPMDFAIAMIDKMNKASYLNCEKCDMLTVQDLISF